MIAEHWHQSQSQSQLSSLEESLKESSSSNLSSEADNTKAPDHDIFETENFVALAAAMSRSRRSFADVAGRKAGKGERKEAGKRKGKAKAMSMSQLIEKFNLVSE